MNVLSVQSSVAYGHVGNAAAVLPLQRLGHEVWPVNTVQFSNHPGYGAWRGEAFSAAHIAQVIEGIEERGALPHCAGVLSGYLGQVEVGAVVLDAVSRVRAANPDALYCCDPVMGDDDRGLYVAPAIAGHFATRAVPMADILTPNRFELGFLTGHAIDTLADILGAARTLLGRGSRLVAVTSVRPPAVAQGRIGILAVERGGAWLVETPELDFPTPPKGTGDVFAALLLGHVLSGHPADAALSLAASGLFALLERTHAFGHRELALVAAQDDLARPPRILPAAGIA